MPEVCRMYCDYCRRYRKAERPACNHLAHALVSLFLCGLWIPVWLLAYAMQTSKPFRCTHCGEVM